MTASKPWISFILDWTYPATCSSVGSSTVVEELDMTYSDWPAPAS